YELVGSIAMLSRVNEVQRPQLAIMVGEQNNTSVLKEMSDIHGIGIIPNHRIAGPICERGALIDLFNGKIITPKEYLACPKPKQKPAHTDPGIVLTPRQSQVLHLVTSRGISNKAIARMLQITESTVKLHISAI